MAKMSSVDRVTKMNQANVLYEIEVPGLFVCSEHSAQAAAT